MPCRVSTDTDGFAVHPTGAGAPSFCGRDPTPPRRWPDRAPGCKGHRNGDPNHQMPNDAAWFGSPVPGPPPPPTSAIPLPSLLTRCLPSPCGRLPRPRTTAAEAPPRPDAFGRRWTCPPAQWQHNGRDNPGSVPTFTMFRSMRKTPSTSPAASLPGTPQTFPREPGVPPPAHAAGFGVAVQIRSRRRALLPGPYPPDSSRFHA